MMSQLEPLLEFDPNYLLDEHKLHVEYCKAQKGGEYNGALRPWGMSRVYNSKDGLNRIGFSAYRTPGEYFATDPNTGLTDKSRKLLHTEETVHASVRVRTVLRGKGEEDQGTYSPTGLKLKNGRWEAGAKILLEETMGELELQLLKQSSRDEKPGDGQPSDPETVVTSGRFI